MKKIASVICILLLTSCQFNVDSITPEANAPIMSDNQNFATALPTKPKNILVVVLGQSNAAFVWKLKQPIKKSNVWNSKKNKFVKDSQFLSESIRQSLPNDSVYFYHYSKGGTNLDIDWAIGTGAQFLLATEGLNKALNFMSTNNIHPDSVIMIWLQGERDASFLAMANRYLQNEESFFNYMIEKFKVNVFISHQISSVLPAKNRQIIATAKINHNADNIHLITLPPEFYKVDKTHLSPNGVIEFSRQVAVVIKGVI